MAEKEQVKKGALLTIGIALLSFGLSIGREGKIWEGIIICVIGFGLIIVFVYLLEKQTVEKVIKVLKTK